MREKRKIIRVFSTPNTSPTLAPSLYPAAVLLHNMVSVNDPLLGDQKRKGFTIFRRIPLRFSIGVAIFCAGAVIGMHVPSTQPNSFLWRWNRSSYKFTFVFVHSHRFTTWHACLFCTLDVFFMFHHSIHHPHYHYLVWQAQAFASGAIFLYLQGAIDKEMRQWKWHKYMFLVGFFDAMNGTNALHCFTS